MIEVNLKYIKDGIHIKPVKNGYEVSTPATGKFKVAKLEELTIGRFEAEIAKQAESLKLKASVHQKLGAYV